jgi:hypothetical protein
MKIKQIGVSAVTYGITLKAIPLVLVRNAQLHPGSALKPQRLLVDGDPTAFSLFAGPKNPFWAPVPMLMPSTGGTASGVRIIHVGTFAPTTNA